MRTLIASVTAFMAVSVLSDSRAPQLVITGTVLEWHAAESITVANEQTGPQGNRIILRDTFYEGDAAGIKPGVRVTVWYRSIGERRSVADKVRLLTDFVTH